MEYKLKCPHKNCGRCLGMFQTTDEQGSVCNVYATPPKKIGKKQHIFHCTCQRCKQEVYVLMGFTD